MSLSDIDVYKNRRTSPLSPLSFIPPVPYPPLRGTFPSRGRLFLSSGEAATFIPHSSFAQSFHSESVDGAAPRADPPRKEPRHGSLTVPHQYGHHSLPAGAFFLYQPAAGKLRTSRDLPKIREGEEDPDARP